MCGITGWVEYDRSINQEKMILTAMTDTLSKRGPDDMNIWDDKHVGLGHKRLVVVDPKGGKQPMVREKNGSKYVLCYNGELYNTEDIRKELLLKGYSFKGHSDTEVLITAYMEWKEKCVDFFNGIFAFAVWDGEREQLFAARDRLGVKPFFYSHQRGQFLFGSEIKALLAHPEVKPVITREGLAEIFALGPSRTPGAGVFKNISELRPAHAMTFSRDGLSIWRYWNVKSEAHEESLDETVEQVRYLVTDAVKRQLVSDVPLCTFLSGGLDSSAITAIAAKQFYDEGKPPLHTYSIDYEDNASHFVANDFQPNSDGYWIELMRKEFGTNHHYCVISQEDLITNLAEAVMVKDLPGMADIDSSLLWFCRNIKKDFVVGLSGECADEIFGGYPWFHNPESLSNDAFPWMRSIKERQALLRSDWQAKLNLEEYMRARYKESLAETPLLEGESELEHKRRQLFYLNMTWFMTNLLDRKDRMSMGASLEVRVPFADHRLVEYAWNIPWEMKMADNREKGILRRALKGVLPEEVLYRKKSPYPKTHHPLYTKLAKDWLTELLADGDSPLLEFFDKEQLKALVETGGASFKTPWYGQLMNGPQLLAYLIQVDLWFKHYHIQIED